jgi:hypothetical protein|tara:strand:- start:1225 stop:1629 length:405 start_codon:yes stop_codon:yes gene_type:complete
MNMTIEDAFTEAIETPPIEASTTYVSLYERVPFYGGPEEGGWWGQDTALNSYHRFATLEQAEQALERIETLAEELTKEAKSEWAKQCLHECEQAEARGMEPSDLYPETAGETEYFATVEGVLNSLESQQDRHYS